MMLTNSEKVSVNKLLGLIVDILNAINKDFSKNINDYPDLLKAKNILLDCNLAAMKVIRKRLRSGFRMIDESIQVPDELNNKINEAYELAVMNEIFNEG